MAFLGLVAGLILFTCSSLDQQTGIGSDIIKDTDPSFMDFNGNFFAVSLDSSDCISETYSLPVTSAGSGFGQHAGKLAAGTSGSFTAYSYLEFFIGGSFVKKFDTTDEVDSIGFFFDTLYDTLLPTAKVVSGATVLILDTTSKNNAGLKNIGQEISTPICSLYASDASDNAHWSGRVASAQFTDVINSHIQDYLTCLKENQNKTTHCDTALENSYLVSLFTSDDSFLWFKNTNDTHPAMVVYSSRPDGDSTKHRIDTLRGYPTMVVSESDSLSEANGTLPIMSWLPGRIAVFKLDLKPLWDTMDSTGFNELLSAGFVAGAELLETENNDTTPPVNYFLSADSLTDISEINIGFDSTNAHYPALVNLHEPSDNTELILPIDYHLQHYLDRTHRHFYLYTRLVSKNIKWKQEVLWSKPRFKAVLTTIN